MKPLLQILPLFSSTLHSPPRPFLSLVSEVLWLAPICCFTVSLFTGVFSGFWIFGLMSFINLGGKYLVNTSAFSPIPPLGSLVHLQEISPSCSQLLDALCPLLFHVNLFSFPSLYVFLFYLFQGSWSPSLHNNVLNSLLVRPYLQSPVLLLTLSA